MASKGKAGKLSFKGDPKTVKQKQKKRTRPNQEESLDQDPLPTRGWIQARVQSHLEGPALLISLATFHPASLYNPTDSNQAVLRSIHTCTSSTTSQQDTDFSPDVYEPTDVHQVFVTHKLIGSSCGEDRWSFKSAEGRYLSVDSRGNVTCDSEAVGPKEEWNPIYDSQTNTFAFQSVTGKYLTVDQPTEEKSTWTLHCAADTVGSCQSFFVKVQAQAIHLYRNNQAKQAQRRLNNGEDEYVARTEDLEISTVKKFQSWGNGRVPVNLSGDHNELSQAKRKGKLAETLLDRRATQKSDRYCK